MEAEKTNKDMCLREENHPVLRRYGRRRYELLRSVRVFIWKWSSACSSVRQETL